MFKCQIQKSIELYLDHNNYNAPIIFISFSLDNLETK